MSCGRLQGILAHQAFILVLRVVSVLAGAYFIHKQPLLLKFAYPE